MATPEMLRAGAAAGGSPGATTSPTDALAQGRYSTSHMESSVTRLLVATKMLLEALTKWAVGQRTEEQVSDVYVRLGNDFNTARLAFGSYGIDMRDLESVPDDLRTCLEACLSEEASQSVLERHLPRVREIIIALLQGLKLKQAQYKQYLMQNRTSMQPGAQTPAQVAAPGGSSMARTASATQSPKRESVRVQRQGVSEGGQPVPTSTEPRPPMPQRESLQRATSGGPSPTSSTRRPMKAPPVESVRSSSQSLRNSTAGTPEEAPPPSAGYRLTDTPMSTSSSASDASPSVAARSRHAPSNSVPSLPPVATTTGHARAGSSASALQTPLSGTSARSQLPTIEASSPLSFESIESAADPSLRALKSRDALERRASKRFSAYTFNKLGQNFGGGLGMGMLGISATPVSNGPGAPADRRVVQSERKASQAKRPSRLNLLNNASDIPPSPQLGESSAGSTPARGAKSVKRASSHSSSASSANRSPAMPSLPMAKGRTPGASPSLSPAANSSTESLPFVDAANAQLPTDDESDAPQYAKAAPAARNRLNAVQDRSAGGKSSGSSSDGANHTITATPTQASYPTHAAPPPGQLTLFLQLGRHTRKAFVDYDPSLPAGGLTIVTLRMLFVNRFQYSPGQDDFPSIYIKDPKSGVSFELEDLEDVQHETLLTLNIEPLDQVKQHMDLSLGALTRELRDLKAALLERERDTRRASVQPSSYAHVADSVPRSMSQSAGKISDSEFAAAGQRVAQITGGAAGAAASSVTGARAAEELRVQYDELQKLRRELAIMRQVQGEFSTDITSLLQDLRERNQRVRKIATADAPVERTFIVAGKAQLDSNSQEVLTLVEDLQDTMDDLKHDVTARGVKPKPAVMKKIVADIEKATKGLEELERYVQSVKPSWKKTWEQELQSIVEEQEFLNHQESLIADLREDHAQLQDVFENIQQVVKLRGTSSRGYIPPAPEEGHQGLNTVMLEVRGQSVDHERRLRALQAAEKQRQRELAGRTDEFADELQGFVDGKALRKTGGHLEAERIRQRRDKATLNAMFSGGGDDIGGAPAAGPSVRPPKFILGRKNSSDASSGGHATKSEAPA